MNDAPTDEANLEKSSRGARAFGGAKGINLLTKVASTVKFVVRANNQGHQHNPDPVNRKQLLRKQSTRKQSYGPMLMKVYRECYESCLYWH